jgi:subtilisin family serine protease
MLFGRPAPSLRPLPLPPAAPDAPEAEPGELVVRGLGPTARAQALAEGFTVVAERGALARLRAPPGLDGPAARDRLRAIAPAATVDLNHLYRPGSVAPGCQGAACAPTPFLALIAWPEAPSCGAGLTVGLIDTPVDASLPALAGRVESVTLRGPDRAPASAAHGTAVATLLAGAGTGAGRGLLPGARVIAVDAFHRRPEGDAADAFDIAEAIGLLAERGVAVAAMAFAGPANAVVDEAGAAAASRGMSAVAAAGNDGPRAPPRYPAAHAWAIAVTGVDRNARIFALAVRGPHIAFAAPGVDLPVLVAADRPPVLRSGTSYAVPFVAAALALARASGLDADVAIRQLAAAARDLGPPGRDPIHGWGLVRAVGDC